MTVTSQTGAARIRVLIADDQAVIRRGMTSMISLEPDMEVVGQASDGIETVEMAESLRPDVVLMDLNMPRKGGVAATREITRSHPDIHVLVLTTLDTDEMVFEAVRAGAHAYLLKDASEEELIETVRAVHRGESRLTPQIARKMMDQFQVLASTASQVFAPKIAAGDQDQPNEASGTAHAQAAALMSESLTMLSAKEEKVLGLIVEGMSNKQIAEKVFLSEGTIKNYVSKIMSKLHANTRTQLAVMAVRKQSGD